LRLLLDTHVWLWWQMAPGRIARPVHGAISDEKSEVFLSAVSSWEMAIKIAAGKLQLPRPLDEMVPEALLADRMQTLPLLHHHSFELASLPMHHRDPFDRMLVAQARREGLTLVTADPMFRRYEVDLLVS
jgi:PIN domain nuclease of toxin-antitoxin system